jgi:hypothetical protein
MGHSADKVMKAFDRGVSEKWTPYQHKIVTQTIRPNMPTAYSLPFAFHWWRGLVVSKIQLIWVS